jgi:hypothetical protein
MNHDDDAISRPGGYWATVTRLRPPGAGAAPEQVPMAAVDGTLALDLDRGPVAVSGQAAPGDRRDDLRAWAIRFSQALVEVLGGDRPVSQLLRLTTPGVYDDLVRRSRILARASGVGTRRSTPLQVRTVRICRPSARAAELSVHVQHGLRSRALAARLEVHDGRWLCTAVQFG